MNDDQLQEDKGQIPRKSLEDTCFTKEILENDRFDVFKLFNTLVSQTFWINLFGTEKSLIWV